MALLVGFRMFFWACQLMFLGLCSTGSKTGASGRCVGCQGSGMKVSIRQLGPNMIQQMQHVCTDCKGSGLVNCSCYSGISLLLLSATDHHLVVESLKVLVLFLAGEVISEKDKCGQCKGQKVVQDKKTLEVHVEKGMQHGQKITFQGEADEAVWSCPQRSHTQKFSILFGSLSLFCCVLKCCCGDIVAVLLCCECELSIYHHVTIVQICNMIFAFLCQMTIQTADLPGLVY